MRESIRKLGKRYVNTRVFDGERGEIIELHGHEIVSVEPSGVFLSHAGHPSAVTKKRINEVLEALDISLKVIQKNKVWGIWSNDGKVKPWIGESIFLKNEEIEQWIKS